MVEWQGGEIAYWECIHTLFPRERKRAGGERVGGRGCGRDKERRWGWNETVSFECHYISYHLILSSAFFRPSFTFNLQFSTFSLALIFHFICPRSSSLASDPLKHNSTFYLRSLFLASYPFFQYLSSMEFTLFSVKFLVFLRLIVWSVSYLWITNFSTSLPIHFSYCLSDERLKVLVHKLVQILLDLWIYNMKVKI